MCQLCRAFLRMHIYVDDCKETRTPRLPHLCTWRVCTASAFFCDVCIDSIGMYKLVSFISLDNLFTFVLNFSLSSFFVQGLAAAVIRTGCDPALRELAKKRTTDADCCYLIFCTEEDVSTVTSFGFLSFSVCDCNQSIQLECNHIHHNQAAA